MPSSSRSRWPERGSFAVDALLARFHERHRRLYTYALADRRSRSSRCGFGPGRRPRAPFNAGLPSTSRGRRPDARIPGGGVTSLAARGLEGPAPCIRPRRLGVGALLTGPAIVEQLRTPPRWCPPPGHAPNGVIAVGNPRAPRRPRGARWKPTATRRAGGVRSAGPGERRGDQSFRAPSARRRRTWRRSSSTQRCRRSFREKNDYFAGILARAPRRGGGTMVAAVRQSPSRESSSEQNPARTYHAAPRATPTGRATKKKRLATSSSLWFCVLSQDPRLPFFRGAGIPPAGGPGSSPSPKTLGPLLGHPAAIKMRAGSIPRPTRRRSSTKGIIVTRRAHLYREGRANDEGPFGSSCLTSRLPFPEIPQGDRQSALVWHALPARRSGACLELFRNTTAAFGAEKPVLAAWAPLRAAVPATGGGPSARPSSPPFPDGSPYWIS